MILLFFTDCIENGQFSLDDKNFLFKYTRLLKCLIHGVNRVRWFVV